MAINDSTNPAAVCPADLVDRIQGTLTKCEGIIDVCRISLDSPNRCFESVASALWVASDELRQLHDLVNENVDTIWPDHVAPEATNG